MTRAEFAILIKLPLPLYPICEMNNTINFQSYFVLIQCITKICPRTNVKLETFFQRISNFAADCAMRNSIFHCKLNVVLLTTWYKMVCNEEVQSCAQAIAAPANFVMKSWEQRIIDTALIPRTIDHRVMRSRSMVLSVSYRLHGA